MNLKTLDHFTLIFYFLNTKNKPEQRKAILDVVRSFINTVDSFRGSKVTIKPKTITIEHEDYFFSFDSKEVFNMGFTTGEGKIDFLNNAMNEVCEKLTKKMGDKGRMAIDIFSFAEYMISKKCNLFTKLIQEQNLHKICYQKGAVMPMKVDLECSGADRNNSIEVSLYRTREENKLEITLTKVGSKQLIPDTAKDAAQEINEMASRILKELISEN
jgi:hypothetical protein